VKERKYFFFEKKKQKTFFSWPGCPERSSAPKRAKVFWFFFSKKNYFLALP
jgi:hypothetical protein